MPRFILDLSEIAAEMAALARVILNIEAGEGADGVGHGKRRPPFPTIDPDNDTPDDQTPTG